LNEASSIHRNGATTSISPTASTPVTKIEARRRRAALPALTSRS
jgi:hypothetical protein